MEFFIVVDVEAAGPNPGDYALLSIGACTLTKAQEVFYIELVPDRQTYKDESMAVNQLSLDVLSQRGTPPMEAMRRFASWVGDVTPEGSSAVFAAFNAPFDWMFVCDYFHRYLGHNPFGHKALDIKALFMGLKGVPWAKTSHRHVKQHYLEARDLPHHALEDAIIEAELLKAILNEIQRNANHKER